MKFESKIAALLDTHLLFALDTGTKQLIGCKWGMGTVDCAVLYVFVKYRLECNNFGESTRYNASVEINGQKDQRSPRRSMVGQTQK